MPGSSDSTSNDAKYYHDDKDDIPVAFDPALQQVNTVRVWLIFILLLHHRY